MATRLGLVVLVGLSAQATGSDAPVGGKATAERRNPPSYRLLDEAESAQVDDRFRDDCTPAESDCLRQSNGRSPEVSEELL
jgi:hypothetical protein